MTIVKSLRYNHQEGRDPIRKHRTHRSKKNRGVTYGLAFIKAYKRRIERLKLEELEKEGELIAK